MESIPAYVCRHKPLAALTTLKLGGVAEYFVEVSSERRLISALKWASGQDMPVHILGGGSNIVIMDNAIEGLVLHMAMRGRTVTQNGDLAHITASAGEVWDRLVEDTIASGFQGFECLSGIPGLVGASPIQNIGAYGQELSDTVKAVRVLDRVTLRPYEIAKPDCGFGYRTSRFKECPHDLIVLGVSFCLGKNQPPVLAHEELRQMLGATAMPDLAEIRASVLRLRRNKSMVLDPTDVNTNSVGSFFINPVLNAHDFGLLEARVSETPPAFPVGDSKIKVPAAWLIERAGFSKGQRWGSVGISSNHALALVHHGGGSSRELLELAESIRVKVLEGFGILLTIEPTIWGQF
ncbi:MAG: UDP-N-acetylmuramate dehydrogenase [Myxococcales bacterium]|nr:UDP-N-acetylmuramate dehydrogenase [Myxococcales bacterium]MCB9707420.1 UDP-N-acetylmuramate dehydrogenase [Myxococcales bacterium]